MKKIFISTVCLLMAVVANAQTNPELKALISQSFNYFPQLEELKKNSEATEMRVELARSNYYPVISGVASYSYLTPVNQANFGGTDLRFQPNNNYNFNISVTQPIWDFGKTNAQIAKAKTDLLSANTNLEKTKAQLAAQVANVFYSMVYLKQAIAVEDSILAFLQANKTIIENRIKRGDALQIDLTNIQSNIDLEQNRKVDFTSSLQKQQALLAYATGNSPLVAANEFDFKPFHEGAEIDYAKQNSFDLLLANQHLLGSELDLKSAKTSKYPLLSFGGGTGYRNGYMPTINPLQFNYVLGVNLSIPIYNAGKVNQNIRISEKNWEMNQVAVKTAENNLKRDLAQVQADIAANEDRIKNSEAQIKYAKEALRLTQSRYKQGTATHLDLLNSSSNLQRIELSQIQFEYQLCLARIEQARLLGWKYWAE